MKLKSYVLNANYNLLLSWKIYFKKKSDSSKYVCWFMSISLKLYLVNKTFFLRFQLKLVWSIH